MVKKQSSRRKVIVDTTLPAKLARNVRLPATMFEVNARAGPKHDTAEAANVGAEAGPSTAPAAGPTIAASKKAKAQQPSRKKRMKSEMGKEKAMEREAITQERVKGREEKKVSTGIYKTSWRLMSQAKRNRAKKAWE
jgi:hypothetical protein